MSDWLAPYLKSDSCYRTFEHRGRAGFLAAGFLCKDGVSADNVDSPYPFYAAVLVLRGTGVFTDEEGQCFRLNPGTLFQRSPRMRHTLRIDPASRWVECFLGMGNRLVESASRRRALLASGFWKEPEDGETGQDDLSTLAMLEQLAVIDPQRAVYHPGLQRSLIAGFSRLLEALKQAEGEALAGLPLKMMVLLEEIRGADLNRKRGEALSPVALACHALSGHLAERVDLKELLIHIPLSYSRLRARFYGEMGVSMGDYRIQRRIEEACTRLLLPGSTPQRVAMELGYSDYPAFSNQFGRRMGITPRQYLQRLGFALDA